MSRKYKHGDVIPVDVIANRLKELAESAIKANWSDFSMRIPAELDHDADLVLMDAAMKLKSLSEENAKLKKLTGQYGELSVDSVELESVNGKSEIVLLADNSKSSFLTDTH